MKKERIYLSGAITDNPNFRKEFEIAETNLQDQGFDVINPASVCARLPEMTHSEYMSICLKMLECCDYIYMMKSWKQSAGAKQELINAKRLQMKVMFEE